MAPFICHLLVLLLQGLALTVVSEDAETIEYTASACYGNSHNYMEINCNFDREVKLVAMINGAKPKDQNCPRETTDSSNYRDTCCNYTVGDCVIQVHKNSFPTVCTKRHFCRPQSSWADTSSSCNNLIYPEFTHYTMITYQCIIPPPETTQPTTRSTTSNTTQPNNPAGMTSSQLTSNTTQPNNPAAMTSNQLRSTTTSPTLANTSRISSTRQVNVKEVSSDDDFTPTMIGGMIAGIVGLMLTIFIFMFYWGRKRQIRISGKPQNNMWDFLLANSMSVRAFRGYDNFSSSRQSVSSEDGSPVIRKTVWLPNISLDSGQGESAVTSDDNCSVVTVEQAGRSNGVRRESSLGAVDEAGEVVLSNRL